MAGKVENLKPCRDTATAKARGKLGGVKSGEAKREKKLMREIYEAYLARKNKVETIEQMFDKVIARADGASVSLAKEFRDTIDGQKLTLSGDAENPVAINIIAVKK